jgi:hypothetical protein
MAASFPNLPIETLTLMLTHFCLHCTKGHDYDSPSQSCMTSLSPATAAATNGYLACFWGMHSLVNIAGVKLVGVLLALLPNLDRLSLQSEGPSAYIPARALSELAGLSQTGPLAKLDTLDICDRPVPISVDYHSRGVLEVAVRTSNLTTLNLHYCGDGGRQSLGTQYSDSMGYP